MNPADRGTVVLEGTWLYDGSTSCRIVIVRREIWFGSGDHEDPPEVADDRDVETFEILYATPGEHDRFSAGGGQCLTLRDARSAAELACGPTVRWLSERVS